jgi:DNA-binding NarL/FixJ family response regulator
MNPPRKILLVEDHPVFRLGLRELLNQEADLEVCAEAEDIPGALAALEARRPDLVVVDLSLKGRSGTELIQEVRRCHGPVPMLVVSMYDEALYAERALAAGARGYLMKQETSDSIVAAVRRVLAGEVVLSERVKAGILDKIAGGGAAGGGDPVTRLTDRELEVFRLIGRGRTTGQIAEALHLSANTIGTYGDRIKDKLGLKSAAELTVHAVRWSEGERGG